MIIQTHYPRTFVWPGRLTVTPMKVAIKLPKGELQFGRISRSWALWWNGKVRRWGGEGDS